MTNEVREAVEQFIAENGDIVEVELFLADSCGTLIGKRLPLASLRKVAKSGMALPAAMFANDMTGDTVEAAGYGTDEGTPDRICRLDPTSLRRVPWYKTPTGQGIITMTEDGVAGFPGDPKAALITVRDRLAARGLTAVVAVELEFYLVDPTWRDTGALVPPRGGLTNERLWGTHTYAMDALFDLDPPLRAIVEAAKIQGLPVETVLAEFAPGQFEVNLRHVADPLRAAEDAVLLKRLIKAVSLTNGVEATFMAKPYADQAGSGLHVHVSLLDRDGAPVFEGKAGEAMLSDAVGGLIATMPEMVAFAAPNANSYRRLRAGTMIAKQTSWGEDSRAAAVRVIRGDPGSTRVEHRISGADANPYLIVASVLAGIEYGLTHHPDPGAPLLPGETQSAGASLAMSWESALDTLRNGSRLRPLLGETLCRMFETIKRAELDQFEQTIPPLDLTWCLRQA